MNSNVPAGTAGTTVIDSAPAAKLIVLNRTPGETSYVRTDTPIARDQVATFASKLVKAYIPITGNRDPNAMDVSALVKTSEVWDKGVGDPNGYVYPQQIHTVFRFAYDSAVTPADIASSLDRHIGYLRSPGVIEGLMRQKTDVL